LVDLVALVEEADPTVNQEILCHHPFDTSKRAKVKPDRVEPLHRTVSFFGEKSENINQ